MNVGAPGAGSPTSDGSADEARGAADAGLEPEARIPVPAPTTPRADGATVRPRGRVERRATSAASTWTGSGRFRSLSSHSATTGMIGSPAKPASNAGASASIAPS